MSDEHNNQPGGPGAPIPPQQPPAQQPQQPPVGEPAQPAAPQQPAQPAAAPVQPAAPQQSVQPAAAPQQPPATPVQPQQPMAPGPQAGMPPPQQPMGAPVQPEMAPPSSTSQVPMPGYSDQGLKYAGFWTRLGAAWLDGFVIMILVGILQGLLGIELFEVRGMQADMTLLGFLFYVVYHTASTGSPMQATPGKRIVGLKVTSVNGERVSYLRAMGRYFASILSFMTLLIGYLMIGFTKQKTGLHDMVAGTRVVHRDPNAKGSNVAIIIVLLFVGIIIAGVLAAMAIPQYQQYQNQARQEMMMQQGGNSYGDSYGGDNYQQQSQQQSVEDFQRQAMEDCMQDPACKEQLEMYKQQMMGR